LRDSAHGALKACGLLGREATTSFISLQRQLPGLLAAPSSEAGATGKLSLFPASLLNKLQAVNAPCALARRQQTAMPFALGERSLPRG